jgi:dipeptidyl aminopeptidase/acylaminoacyl peptidase
MSISATRIIATHVLLIRIIATAMVMGTALPLLRAQPQTRAQHQPQTQIQPQTQTQPKTQHQPHTQPQPTRERVKVTDMLRIKTVGETHLSKDGRRAVFTLTSIEPDTAGKPAKWDYKYVTQLWLAPTDGSALPRPITTAREGATQPAWSPDDRQIAFVRTVDGKPQIFLLALDGGEPTQLTHFRYGASSPKWSPDGKELLFSARIKLQELIRDSILNSSHALPAWPFEKPGITGNAALKPSSATPDPDGNMDQVRAYLENDVTDKKAKVVDKLNFQDEMEVNPEVSFNHWFTQSVQPGSTPVAVTHGFYNFSSADYSPDGKELYFVAHLDSAEDPDRALESEIYFADRDGGKLTLALGEKGQAYNAPRLSPNGLTLAFEVSPTATVSVPQLVLADVASHFTAKTVIPFDRAATGLSWTDDGQYLYFIAQSNGGAPLYRLNISTKKLELLSDFNSGVTAFDCKNGHLIFGITVPADPSELYAGDASMKGGLKLSTFNTDWLAHRQLSTPERHGFTNGLGELIEYWVMKPIGYTAGQHYPLLLDIHGGPSAMWGPGEPSMWHEFQYFCAKGFGVVYCNPRGSGGYGTDFLRANIKDWGTGPTSDVFAALDRTVAEGWADTSRMVVTGGSYAGYLVAWIVGHDHRFKAACAQRGVYDLSTFFGEGNAWRLVPQYFGGYPWEPEARAILDRESPITYVANITTPLIIFHGENDRRTGFVQGEMLYRSLKVLHRPVEYVRHPGATHEITRSGDNRQRIDQLLRTYEFFERYVGE